MTFSPIILLMLIASLSAKQSRHDPCRCKDREAPHRYRYFEKHSTNFPQYAGAKDTITCRDIIAWHTRYAKATLRVSGHGRRSGRVPGTPEDSLYTLAGYMYYVRHESKKKGDCDLHIEIGTADASSPRAIVEATNDDCALQKMILEHVASRGYSLEEEFPAGLPCVVKGLGFYDGNQPVAEHGRPGKTNMSLWELHPIKSIQFR